MSYTVRPKIWPVFGKQQSSVTRLFFGTEEVNFGEFNDTYLPRFKNKLLWFLNNFRSSVC